MRKGDNSFLFSMMRLALAYGAIATGAAVPESNGGVARAKEPIGHGTTGRGRLPEPKSPRSPGDFRRIELAEAKRDRKRAARLAAAA